MGKRPGNCESNLHLLLNQFKDFNMSLHHVRNDLLIFCTNILFPCKIVDWGNVCTHWLTALTIRSGSHRFIYFIRLVLCSHGWSMQKLCYKIMTSDLFDFVEELVNPEFCVQELCLNE